MLTRSQVARRLGRSVATVRRLEHVELFPTVDGKGVHWFDEEEVERLANEMDDGRRLPHGLLPPKPDYSVRSSLDAEEVAGLRRELRDIRGEVSVLAGALNDLLESVDDL